VPQGAIPKGDTYMGSSLKGKVALVTGGSSGIGLASAVELAERGAKVVVTGRRAAELHEAVRLIGHEAYGFVADVSNLQDLDRVYAEIGRAAGRLDIVFANAGGGDMMPLNAITEEHFDRIFGTNVKGLLFTVQKALPLMTDGGSIILTGSTTSKQGTENFSVYSASKAAVRNLARSWILDLRTRGIRVNVISPGAIATPGLAGLVPPEHKDGLFEALAKVTPMGRLGNPEEIAKAVAFLASDDASFVNGVELFVDGGKAQV
jgi:NAD(P)-dependent dehydrogenase (short-subunit alcohol dehydrogenase family)